jgi:hypothetical protein
VFATIALLVCAPALAYFLAKWLFQKDTERENKRRRAAEVAAIYKKRGLEDIPSQLINFSVGDVSGVIHGFVDALHKYVMVKDEEVEAQIDRVLTNMVKAAMTTEGGRDVVSKAMAAVTPAKA